MRIAGQNGYMNYCRPISTRQLFINPHLLSVLFYYHNCNKRALTFIWVFRVNTRLLKPVICTHFPLNSISTKDLKYYRYKVTITLLFSKCCVSPIKVKFFLIDSKMSFECYFAEGRCSETELCFAHTGGGIGTSIYVWSETAGRMKTIIVNATKINSTTKLKFFVELFCLPSHSLPTCGAISAFSESWFLRTDSYGLISYFSEFIGVLFNLLV